MTPLIRRVLQAILYEIGAIALTSPIIGLAFDTSASSALTLAAIMSTIALAWNYVFNAIFERWESRQTVKGRSIWRRLAHGIGFEGGLVMMLVPLMAYWLDISLLNAFYAEMGILLVFFVYAITFTWAFDKVFGLPESAISHEVKI
ncbi:MAG: PACE efflux transporter [Pseudomonadota bacterium]